VEENNALIQRKVRRACRPWQPLDGFRNKARHHHPSRPDTVHNKLNRSLPETRCVQRGCCVSQSIAQTRRWAFITTQLKLAIAEVTVEQRNATPFPVLIGASLALRRVTELQDRRFRAPARYVMQPMRRQCICSWALAPTQEAYIPRCGARFDLVRITECSALQSRRGARYICALERPGTGRPTTVRRASHPPAAFPLSRLSETAVS